MLHSFMIIVRLLRGCDMFELAFGLVVGACLGYGVRSCLSHYRRIATRRRLGVN